MIEALACGTPVVAFPEGAAPEIVEHGRSGFLCADEDEMAGAISRLRLIDRSDCRRRAELGFSASRMVADHVELYRAVLTGAAPFSSSGGREGTEGVLTWP